jgi:hypothetical protein
MTSDFQISISTLNPLVLVINYIDCRLGHWRVFQEIPTATPALRFRRTCPEQS